MNIVQSTLVTTAPSEIVWRSFYFLKFLYMQTVQNLDSSIHHELRYLIQQEPGNTGEMSIRPRIQRAIGKLISKNNLSKIPDDIILMHKISGYNPLSPSIQIQRVYDDSLQRLSDIMGQV